MSFLPLRVKKKGRFIKARTVFLSPICKGFLNVVWANCLSNAPLTPLPPLNPNPPGSFPAYLPFLPLILCLCYPQLIQTSEVFSWTTEPASSGSHISNIPCFQGQQDAFQCHLIILLCWGDGSVVKSTISIPITHIKSRTVSHSCIPALGERGLEQVGPKGMLVSWSANLA